ncbi:hypothetical protein SK128_002238 [Halocaridina rubra]|uniref:Uncharacterized protein n=1 Tax=Halocaridina rubra TaxID=373956 RepID=A0AAN8XCH8_HALRR
MFVLYFMIHKLETNTRNKWCDSERFSLEFFLSVILLRVVYPHKLEKITSLHQLPCFEMWCTCLSSHRRVVKGLIHSVFPPGRYENENNLLLSVRPFWGDQQG